MARHIVLKNTSKSTPNLLARAPSLPAVQYIKRQAALLAEATNDELLTTGSSAGSPRIAQADFQSETPKCEAAKGHGQYEIKNYEEVGYGVNEASPSRGDTEMMDEDASEAETVIQESYSGTPVEIADYILSQPAGFVTELLDHIFLAKSEHWIRAKKHVASIVSLDKKYKITSNNISVRSGLTTLGAETSGAEPGQIVQRYPKLWIHPHVTANASTIMTMFHDTCDSHECSRIHSEQAKLNDSTAIHSRRADNQKEWENEYKRGRQAVKEILKRTQVIGMRGVRGMRDAFDYIVTKSGGPTVMWKDSDAWFRASIEIIDSNPEYALLIFEKDDRTFIDAYTRVIKKAEKQALEKWLYAKLPAGYADLMGTGPDAKYVDRYRTVKGFTLNDQPHTVKLGPWDVYEGIQRILSGVE